MIFFAIRYWLLALCICAAALLGSNSPAVSQTNQRIALSLPLSGPTQLLARQFLLGAERRLALAGEGTAELTVFDDGCDPDIAELAAQDINAADPAIVTGILCNTTAHVLADALKESGQPLLIAGARSPRLTRDRERFGWQIWQLAPDDDEPADVLVSELAERWRGTGFAIVDDGTAYGRSLADRVRAAFLERGMEPQFADTFRPTQSTQARLVRRLRRAGITHVFIGGSAQDVAMVSTNAQELGIPLEIAGGGVMSVAPYLPPENQPADGVIAVLNRMEVRSEVPEDLNARLAADALEPEPYVLMGYLAIDVALAALQVAGPVKAVLSENAFETPFGTVAFGANGANRLAMHKVFIWQDGRFRPLNARQDHGATGIQ